MPDFNVDASKVVHHLNQKGIDGCTACGHADFDIPDSYAALFTIQDGNIEVTGDNVIPLIMVLCNNCGHMMHFQAHRLGLSV